MHTDLKLRKAQATAVSAAHCQSQMPAAQWPTNRPRRFNVTPLMSSLHCLVDTTMACAQKLRQTERTWMGDRLWQTTPPADHSIR